MTAAILGEWDFPRIFEAVPGARHHVRKLASGHIGPGDLANNVEQAAGEVLANAVEHGSGQEVQVRVIGDGISVRVEVRDSGCTSPPRMPDEDPGALDAVRGRGLFLVRAYASAWGLESDCQGTLVWFEVTP